MNYTSINICSKALIKLGANGITSFEDGTAEAEVSASLYPLVRDSLLSSYPWSFALAQKKLARLKDVPLADYLYAYQLPGDFIRVISAGAGLKGRGMEYRIHENMLHSNISEVNLTYIFRPLETSFPAFFTDALVSRLSAEFCLPLTENSTRADALSKRSDVDIKQARIIDAQQATPKKFEDFTLTEARR